jgi:hypothetical protein
MNAMDTEIRQKRAVSQQAMRDHHAYQNVSTISAFTIMESILVSYKNVPCHTWSCIPIGKLIAAQS